MIGVHKDNESKGKAEGFEECRFGNGTWRKKNVVMWQVHGP